MIITYYGEQFFKVSQGDTTIAFNPTDKSETKDKKGTRFGADIVLSTTHHPLYNGIEQVSFGDKEPFVIDGAGDYEVKGIFVHGTQTTATLDKKPYMNTMYSLTMEGISMTFLGALTEVPKRDDIEGLTSPDILFVPFGGELIDPAAAYRFAVSLEPSIMIPMASDEKSLAIFLKEAGVPKVEALDKLVLKRKDLDMKVAEVVVLQNN